MQDEHVHIPCKHTFNSAVDSGIYKQNLRGTSSLSFLTLKIGIAGFTTKTHVLLDEYVSGMSACVYTSRVSSRWCEIFPKVSVFYVVPQIHLPAITPVVHILQSFLHYLVDGSEANQYRLLVILSRLCFGMKISLASMTASFNYSCELSWWCFVHEYTNVFNENCSRV